MNCLIYHINQVYMQVPDDLKVAIIESSEVPPFILEFCVNTQM